MSPSLAVVPHGATTDAASLPTDLTGSRLLPPDPAPAARRGTVAPGEAARGALLDVYASARRLVALQARADAAGRPATLADAIERDFLLYDLHEAGRDLRDAVEAADGLGAASAAVATAYVVAVPAGGAPKRGAAPFPAGLRPVRGARAT